jgi:hypothetical protein
VFGYSASLDYEVDRYANVKMSAAANGIIDLDQDKLTLIWLNVGRSRLT